MVKSIRVNATVCFRVATLFDGVMDRFGRTMGVDAVVYEMEYASAPEGATFGYSVSPGTYYEASVQQTRDKMDYGAKQRRKVFLTKAEAVEYVTQIVEKRRKDYTKRDAALRVLPLSE